MTQRRASIDGGISRANKPIAVRELSPTAYGWLPVALPARAHRIRVIDDSIATILSGAGADLTSDSPDVEIFDARTARAGSDADVAIVVLDQSDAPRKRVPMTRARHVFTALKVRAKVAQVRRELMRHGYGDVSVLFWDSGCAAHRPGLRSGGSLRERLARRAVITGSRVEPQPAILDAALAHATTSVALRSPLRRVWVRARLSLAATDEALLRIAVDEQGRRQIADQAVALLGLRAAGPPPSVAQRIPWSLATGRTGIADWSIEQLLPGKPPVRLTPQLADECLEFLITLYGTPGGSRNARSLTAMADGVASVCRADDAVLARGIGELLERELSGLPRGFGHGDFFPGNLLVAEERLTGVIDWDAGGPGSLPLVDLFHLQVTRTGYGLDSDWGMAVIERLLPQADVGGNSETRTYCKAIGIDPDPPILRYLVYAYWLGYVDYQIRTHPCRIYERRWVERNVQLVLRTFTT